MGKIAGSLQHLGGDRWRVRVYAGRGPDGRQQARSRSFRADGQRAAERAAAAHVTALHAENAATVERRGTIAELADDWLELKRRQGRAPTTLDGYATIVDRIVDRFGRLPVDELTGRDIDRWYGELTTAGTVTASTVHHHHAVLRGMLRQAERWGLVTRVATRQASPPSVPRPEISPPATSVVVELLAVTAGTEFGGVLRILAATGARRGEVVGLHWSDLVENQLTIRRSVTELTGGGLHIGPTKGRRPRTLTVTGDVVEVFARQRALLEARAGALEVELVSDGPVFADLTRDPTGATPRRPGWVSARWGKLRAEHPGAGGVRLHDLRHWNATTLIDQGISPPVAAARLGHAQVSTTLNIYASAVAASDQAAADVLAHTLTPA